MKFFMLVLLACVAITAEADNRKPRVIQRAATARRVTNFVCVSPFGDDLTAAHGNTNRPARTLARALSLALPGDNLLLAAGDYFSPGLTLSNVSLVGSGMYTTRIYGGPDGSSIILGVNGVVLLSDCTVASTNKTGQFVFNVNTMGQGAKAITLQRVRIIGDSDGISMSDGVEPIQFKAYDCVLNTHYDAAICSSVNTNSAFDFYRCKIDVRRDLAVFGGTVRGMAAVNATVGVYDCAIRALNGAGQTYALFNRGGTITVFNTFLEASSPSGDVRLLSQEDGSVTFIGDCWPLDLLDVGAGTASCQ